jgi:thiamine biosynthesis protein ThiS
MTTATTIAVTLNGERRQIRAGATIASMLRELGIDPARVAVEHNFSIVPRSTLDEAPVADGDTFEIVHFVGGG